jgi:hypothetical protein
MARGSQLFDEAPGNKVQKFYVVEKRSYDPICDAQNFYKEYSSLGVKFVLTDDNKYVATAPQVVIKQDEKNYETDPVRLEITIPVNEQFKLPTDRDIFIVMTAHWTNEQFESVIDADQLVFQHLVNKIRF